MIELLFHAVAFTFGISTFVSFQVNYNQQRNACTKQFTNSGVSIFEYTQLKKHRSAPDGLAPGAAGEPGADGIVGGPRTPQQIAAQKRLQQTQAQVDEVRIGGRLLPPPRESKLIFN